MKSKASDFKIVAAVLHYVKHLKSLNVLSIVEYTTKANSKAKASFCVVTLLPTFSKCVVLCLQALLFIVS